MERDAVKLKLTDVFRRLFDDDRLEISDTTTASDIKGWDSLTHINLILAVERAFKIRMTTREARGMKNVGDMINLVASKAG